LSGKQDVALRIQHNVAARGKVRSGHDDVGLIALAPSNDGQVAAGRDGSAACGAALAAAGLAGAADANVDVDIDAADFGWVFRHRVVGIPGGQTALDCRITYRTHPWAQQSASPQTFRTDTGTFPYTAFAWFVPTCSQC